MTCLVFVTSALAMKLHHSATMWDQPVTPTNVPDQAGLWGAHHHYFAIVGWFWKGKIAQLDEPDKNYVEYEEVVMRRAQRLYRGWSKQRPWCLPYYLCHFSWGDKTNWSSHKKPSHKVHSLREVDPQAQQKGCYNTVLLQAAQIYGVQWATFKEILNSCLHLMLNP